MWLAKGDPGICKFSPTQCWNCYLCHQAWLWFTGVLGTEARSALTEPSPQPPSLVFDEISGDATPFAGLPLLPDQVWKRMTAPSQSSGAAKDEVGSAEHTSVHSEESRLHQTLPSGALGKLPACPFSQVYVPVQPKSGCGCGRFAFLDYYFLYLISWWDPAGICCDVFLCDLLSLSCGSYVLHTALLG